MQTVRARFTHLWRAVVVDAAAEKSGRKGATGMLWEEVVLHSRSQCRRAYRNCVTLSVAETVTFAVPVMEGARGAVAVMLWEPGVMKVTPLVKV